MYSELDDFIEFYSKYSNSSIGDEDITCVYPTFPRIIVFYISMTNLPRYFEKQNSIIKNNYNSNSDKEEGLLYFLDAIERIQERKFREFANLLWS